MPGLHCVDNEWHVKLARMESRSGWGEVREESYRAPNVAGKPIAIGSDRTGRTDLPTHRTLRLGGKVQLIRSRHVLKPKANGRSRIEPFRTRIASSEIIGSSRIITQRIECALHGRNPPSGWTSGEISPVDGASGQVFSQLDNIAMSSSGRHWFVFHVGCRQTRSNSRLVLTDQCTR